MTELASERGRRSTALVFTDGSCVRNPGPGGWAALILPKAGEPLREISGSESFTANNKMELRAVTEGLKSLREPSAVHVITDSQYVKKGITEWLPTWKANGWMRRTADGGLCEVRNRDLWEELETVSSHHEIRWEWVRGHSGNRWNSRCHELAVAAAKRAASGQAKRHGAARRG